MAIMTFSDRLSKVRKTREMSQLQLAAACTIPASSISHYEAGRRAPSIGTLVRISQALQVSSDWLLGMVTHEVPAIDRFGRVCATPCRGA